MTKEIIIVWFTYGVFWLAYDSEISIWVVDQVATISKSYRLHIVNSAKTICITGLLCSFAGHTNGETFVTHVWDMGLLWVQFSLFYVWLAKSGSCLVIQLV